MSETKQSSMTQKHMRYVLLSTWGRVSAFCTSAAMIVGLFFLLMQRITYSIAIGIVCLAALASYARKQCRGREKRKLQWFVVAAWAVAVLLWIPLALDILGT